MQQVVETLKAFIEDRLDYVTKTGESINDICQKYMGRDLQIIDFEKKIYSHEEAPMLMIGDGSMTATWDAAPFITMERYEFEMTLVTSFGQALDGVSKARPIREISTAIKNMMRAFCDMQIMVLLGELEGMRAELGGPVISFINEPPINSIVVTVEDFGEEGAFLQEAKLMLVVYKTESEKLDSGR